MRAAPTVLLVDDFQDALNMYSEYLDFRGYRVVTASSGAAALTAAKAHPPDVVFMDLRMPLMTGAEALHLLRGDPALASIPVVAFTAHAMDDERRGALREGFDEVIAKPCLPNDLVTAIERILAKARGVTPKTSN